MASRVAILILDDDLGFAMWLSRVLTEAGLPAFPVTTSAEALSLIDVPGLVGIDLLIANFDLQGVRGVIEQLVSRGEKVRLIAIGELGTAGRRKIHARMDRPQGKVAPSPTQYLNVIRAVL